MSGFNPCQLPSEKELTESEKIKTLISFYGCIQMKVTFDGKRNLST